MQILVEKKEMLSFHRWNYTI